LMEKARSSQNARTHGLRSAGARALERELAELTRALLTGRADECTLGKLARLDAMIRGQL